ncbi:hypothetical protein BDW74DRAFT_175895 [Aspergillus multicolor]|uniref:uncharacterized protein n=1 Tax=Aspergillus multicolor TaxID=41759 RepID=UPI003CCCC1FB
MVTPHPRKPFTSVPEGPCTLPISERAEAAHGAYYIWHITDPERAHIASLLGCPVSKITAKRTYMQAGREVCRTCSKPSGLDDLVSTAMAQGVHSTAFMLDVLANGPKGNSPSHGVHCSGCGGKFGRLVYWEEHWANWFE